MQFRCGPDHAAILKAFNAFRHFGECNAAQRQLVQALFQPSRPTKSLFQRRRHDLLRWSVCVKRAGFLFQDVNCCGVDGLPIESRLPANEDSAGRTSDGKTAPHPLADKLIFLVPSTEVQNSVSNESLKSSGCNRKRKEQKIPHAIYLQQLQRSILAVKGDSDRRLRCQPVTIIAIQPCIHRKDLRLICVRV